jgi:hypothetical protein
VVVAEQLAPDRHRLAVQRLGAGEIAALLEQRPRLLKIRARGRTGYAC